MSKKNVPVKERTLDAALERTLSRSVDDLDFVVLGALTYWCIQEAGIKTIGDLAIKTTDEVLAWKKARPMVVERINRALEHFDLSLDLEFVSPSEEVGKLSPVSNLMYPLNE